MANKFCEAARAHFSDELDGEPLTPVARAIVSLHLTTCPMCRRFNRSLIATRDALKLLKDEPVPGEKPGEEKAPPR